MKPSVLDEAADGATVLDAPPRSWPPPEAERIGASRSGRPVWGLRYGDGPGSVSLIAGCHADEPVGPAMLERLATWLSSEGSAALRARFRFSLVPHVNPDGDEANRAWSESPLPLSLEEPTAFGYDLRTYLDRVVRELPGEDLEFGFPPGKGETVRPEAQAVADFLAPAGPFDLHATFHGMGFARGPWFLLEPLWVERTRPLREELTRAVDALGYQLHDVDRGGEKGFWRIAEGFCTRPDSRAMRDFFLARGERDVAARFRPSSMEYARSLGGDPLTVVSEMPLFLVDRVDWNAQPGSDLRMILEEGLAAGRSASDLGIRAMPIRDQMHLQLAFLASALETVDRYECE